MCYVLTKISLSSQSVKAIKKQSALSILAPSSNRYYEQIIPPETHSDLVPVGPAPAFSEQSIQQFQFNTDGGEKREEKTQSYKQNPMINFALKGIRSPNLKY